MSETTNLIEQHIYLDGQAISPDFDGATFFEREVYKDNLMFREVKRWIVDDLKLPLDTMSGLACMCHHVELPEEVTVGNFKRFEPTPFFSFIVMFKDKTYHIRNLNMDDYDKKAGEQA